MGKPLARGVSRAAFPLTPALQNVYTLSFPRNFMAKIVHDVVYASHEQLLPWCCAIFEAHGVPRDDAWQVAWHLVETNLRGTDSHGVARIPHYIRRIKAGSIQPKPMMAFDRLAASMGRVDGGHGLGHLVMGRAVEEVIGLASEAGSGWVSVCNSSHCGALAPFGLRLAKAGMIGIVFSHVDPMVLPYGSAEPFCGTNPICLTVPGENEEKTLCLDMATSIVPWNLVANAAREGVPIPAGWAVDEKGEETTDATRVHALYPFGMHKGSGLGIMIDAFCSLLSGAPYGPDVPKMYGDLSQQRRLGGLVGAIRIDAFAAPDEFRRRAAEMAMRIGSLAPAKGFDRVLVPGQPEIESKQLRSRTGIPIGVQILAELNDVATDAGLSPLASYPGPLAS
jgi:ureidoglycolate dehydrogenase (NAD+)